MKLKTITFVLSLALGFNSAQAGGPEVCPTCGGTGIVTTKYRISSENLGHLSLIGDECFTINRAGYAPGGRRPIFLPPLAFEIEGCFPESPQEIVGPGSWPYEDERQAAGGKELTRLAGSPWRGHHGKFRTY